MLRELMPSTAQPESRRRTIFIIQHELRNLYRCILKEHKSKEVLYDKYASTEMSDIITQCRLFCEQSGWDYEYLEVLGEERFKEKMSELA